MKNILFSALLCLSVLVISCTSEQNNANYTFQIPRSLIKEAKNTPTVPAFTKKIADTELICYLVDTCAGKLDGAPVEINMTEIGFSNTVHQTLRQIGTKSMDRCTRRCS